MMVEGRGYVRRPRAWSTGPSTMGVDSASVTAEARRKRPTAEPEDATTETRRIFGDSVMADLVGTGRGTGSKGTRGPSPPPSERGLRAMFTNPTQAMAEIRDIKHQFADLKQLAYQIQGMAPKQLTAEWDTLRTVGNEQYAQLERSISRFVRHTNGAPRWQPRFYTYYVLPILLNILKLAIFCSPAGIIGVLLYDVFIVGAFTVLRHPYAVSVTVSYAADHDAIPSMAKTACLYLTYEAAKSTGKANGITLIETWDAYRLDMRPLYTAGLWLYFAYAVAHQAYTLYFEKSWKHRRWLDVFLSVASHQVNNISFVAAFYYCYEHESALYLFYVARMCYRFLHAGPAIQPNFYTSHRVQHFVDLYPFVHKYHHVGHPTTPFEAQEGGLMEFWAGHTAFLLGARTGVSKRPTPVGHILGMLRVASAHGLWITFIQGRTFHDIQAGEKYILAKRENSARNFRREGEKQGHTRFPCLHYYHHVIPDQQFSYDSFARLDLVFGTQHKASETLLKECRAGTIDLP